MNIMLGRTNATWTILRPLAAAMVLAVTSAAPAGDAVPMLAPGSASDTTADAVLAQLDFVHRDPNFVDGRGLYTNGGPWAGSGWGDVVVDTSVTPNRVYVADAANNRVLAWKDVVAFTTHAAAYSVIGQADFSSTTCNRNSGTPSAASLCYPSGVAVDSHGNLYVADYYNHRVLYYADPLGLGKPRTGLAATDVFGQQGSFTTNHCNGYGVEADSLCHPADIALDASENLYAADNHNHRVLIYRTPQTITATAGSGDTTADKVLGQLGSFSSNIANLSGVTADGLYYPLGLALDTAGNLLVADYYNHRVLKYLTPLAGDTTADQVYGQSDFTLNACNIGGVVSSSGLCYPASVAVNGAGTLRYISDGYNHRVLGYTNADTVADLVLGQFGSFTDATCNNTKGGILPPVNSRSLCHPAGMALDAVGNLYLVDGANNRVTKYTGPVANSAPATGVLGQYLYTTGFANALDGRGIATSDWPSQGTVAIDRSVVPNRVYVADTPNNRVLAWSDIAAFATHVPATKVFGQANLYANACNRGNPSPTNATLCYPHGVAVDALGNLYVADVNNHRVLEYNIPFATDTIADKVFGQNGDFATAICNKSGVTADALCIPYGVAVDGTGNLYLGDHSNSRVLEYHTPLASDTTADKVFGQANSFVSNACNLGGITRNSLCNPLGVTIDGAGNLYVADYNNHRVLEYNTPLTTDVAADKVFGQANSFLSNVCNVGGVVSANGLCSPYMVAVDSGGTVFIADTGNSRVLKYLAPLTTNRTADAVFGQSNLFNRSGCRGVSPDTLCSPQGLALDSTNNLYVTDGGNNRVLKYLTP